MSEERETQQERGGRKFNRRTFFKGAAAASVVAVAGGAWRVGAWWDQEAAAGFRILSHQEVLISDAIAEALFPGEQGAVRIIPSGPELGLTKYLDDLLVEMLDEVTGNAIRVLMHALDEMAILGGGGSVSRFHKRGLEERIAILKAWDGSSLSARRSVFSALKLFYAMGYCEHPEILGAMQIEYSCMGQENAIGA